MYRCTKINDTHLLLLLVHVHVHHTQVGQLSFKLLWLGLRKGLLHTSMEKPTQQSGQVSQPAHATPVENLVVPSNKGHMRYGAGRVTGTHFDPCAMERLSS